MDEAARRFWPEEYHRFSTAYRHFEQVHHLQMAGPHWYLGLLGVSPGYQGQGLGRALLAPVLHRADHEGLPCYLETFVPQNVPFYEHRGFHVVDAGVEPHGQVPFWAIRRQPHAAR
jgi:GNAT superfamily N-acetyltransferase